MNGEAPLLAGLDLVKAHGRTPALRGASVALAAGEILAVTGASGSGKSTLLHMLAGIVRPDEGSVSYAGQRLDRLPEQRLTELRRTEFGVVFQFGQLIPELTAVDNVGLPLLPALVLAGAGGMTIGTCYATLTGGTVTVPYAALLVPVLVYACCLLSAATALPLLRRSARPGELRYA